MPPQAFRSAARLPAGSADRFISAFLWIPPPIGGPFSGQSMSPKHILLIPALALLMYLGMYSWNQRTHILDNFAANTGLEASGVVLKSVRMVQDTVMGAWNRYLDLVDVREENDELKKQVEQLRHKLLMASEERAELVRLRRLLTLTPPEGWQTLGARVLAGRMGANSALASVLIGRGYMTGAIPGTPVMTPQGVAGRVLRAGPSSATVLLLVDPGSRIAVISQESRIQGVLVGGGPDKPLEMRFVSHNDVIRAGEILVTSGLDDAFPKGIPVARVLSATPSDLSPFQSIQAAPLAALSDLEELLLISRVEGSSVSGSLSGVLEAPRSPSSDSAGSPAAQRAQPQPGQQGSTIPGPPRPDAPFFLSGPTPPPGLPLRSRLALQQALPGTDVLVAGLFLALQERRPFQLAVVLLALILVQEGVGTLDFGTSVLWYLLVITLFFIGRWMFETENWLFVLLLSGCIGLAHYGVIWLMTRLQFIPLDTTQLLDESILQALLTPFVWQCSMMARRWVVPNENNTA